MIAGELESLDRFQLMERCRMLVGIFEKVALYEFGIEVWDGLDAWEMPKKTAYDHPSGPPCRARLDLVRVKVPSTSLRVINDRMILFVA